MEGRKLEIVISASDNYSAALKKFNAALETTGVSTNKLTSQIYSFTNANDWAATGVRKFNNILEGIAFGGMIGAVSAVTTGLISAAKEAFNTSERITELESSITSQANAWNLLPTPIGNATAATVAYYNAELRLQKLLSADKAEGLKKLQTELELREVGVMSLFRGTTRQLAEQEIELAGVNIKLEKHNALMALEEVTLARVTAGLKKKANALTPAFELPKGGGSLMAFVMGDLDMAKEKIGLAGITLGGELVRGIEKGVSISSALGDLNYSSVYITRLQDDAAYNEAYFAILDERFKKESDYEDALLNRRLATPTIADFLNEKLNIYQGHYSMLTEMSNMYSDAEMEQAIRRKEVQLYIASETFGMMSNLMQNLTVLTREEGGVAFNTMKGFAIAQTTIDTYRGAQGAFAALSNIPIVGPALGTAAAASAVVAGMARVNQIASMQPGGSASGSTISAGGAANPSYSGGSTGAYPVPTRGEPRQSMNVVVHINALDPSSINWDRLMEDNIAPALQRLSGDRDVTLDIKVARR